MINGLINWLDERMGIVRFYREQIAYELPEGINYWRLFGGLTIGCITIQILSGFYMLSYFMPEMNQAHQSIRNMCLLSPSGAIVRNLHRWSATFGITFVMVHAFHGMAIRAYRAPREINWWSGMLLGTIFVLFLITGVILPWDWRSYLALTVWSDWVKLIPGVGGYLQGLILSEFSLGRDYIVHIMLLPAMLFAVLGVHIIVMRRLGLSAGVQNMGETAMPDTVEKPKKGIQWWPHFVLRLAVVFMVVTAVMVALATQIQVPFHAPYTIPLPDEGEGIPGPEWLFLLFWQGFKHFRGSLKTYNFLMPLSAISLFIVMFMLPFSSRISFSKIPGLKGIIGKIAAMKPGFLKSFMYVSPVVLFATIVFLAIFNSGHKAKSLGCDSCHTGMEHRTFLMSVPPSVDKYYNAGKTGSVGASGIPVLIPKDAYWQVRHLYEPNSFAAGW